MIMFMKDIQLLILNQSVCVIHEVVKLYNATFSASHTTLSRKWIIRYETSFFNQNL